MILGLPRRFFNTTLINYCPLVWLEAGGKNRTPEQLPAAGTNPVYAACNQHLSEVLHLLKPTMAIGIGGFAQKRLAKIIDAPESGLKAIRVGTILHPSPASPMANRGWANQARAQLKALGAPCVSLDTIAPSCGAARYSFLNRLSCFYLLRPFRYRLFYCF